MGQLASTKAASEQSAQWAEPFSAMYWRIKVQSYLIIIAFLAVTVLGYGLFRVATAATALVYIVAPDGEAIAVLDREANRAPSKAEVDHYTKQFIESMYGFNSSTVHQDLATALTMCSEPLAAQFRTEIASAAFIEQIRDRGIRSEVLFEEVKEMESSRRHSQLRAKGVVRIFPIGDFEGNPIEVRPFDLILVLSVVPRNPSNRLNGLEIVRLVHARQQNVPPDSQGNLQQPSKSGT